MHVIRRLGVLLVLVLAMAGCAGAERSAVTVGDSSISRADLIELVVALNPGGPDELPPTISAEVLRDVANTWTRDAAISAALGEKGIVMTEDERVDINLQIESAFSNAQIGVLAPLSGGFEALQRNVWVASKLEELDEVSSIRVQELLDDADVESRLGAVDPETTLIVAR